MYSSAPYWFAVLFVVSFLGFWPSYFSPSAPRATLGQHLHAATMMIWVLFLVVQPWLIRIRKRNIHRLIGRFSLLWAPVIVITALVVIHHNLLRFPQPYPPLALSFFWLGLASAALFAVLYGLAIYNRRNMQLHARYMAATAMPFIVAGLGRLLTKAGEATGLAFLGFDVALWAPVIVGGVMLFHEKRKGRVRFPWVLATVSWLIVVVGFYQLPKFAWFSALAAWYQQVLS